MSDTLNFWRAVTRVLTNYRQIVNAVVVDFENGRL
jgi:hypothetical protein